VRFLLNDLCRHSGDVQQTLERARHKSPWSRMRFKQLRPSKFRPKNPATKKNGKPAMYHPKAIKAGLRHIDTESLPDSPKTRRLVTDG
jgi:hypothetical protein